MPCILYSARIDARLAADPAAGVAAALAASAADERIAVLDRAHDTRYDEDTIRAAARADANAGASTDGPAATPHLW